MRKGDDLVRIEPIEKKWLSMAAAMEYLGMSRDFIDAMRLEPGINTYRVGRTIFLKKDEIDRFIEKQKSAI